jgi:hypothetical protein
VNQFCYNEVTETDTGTLKGSKMSKHYALGSVVTIKGSQFKIIDFKDGKVALENLTAGTIQNLTHDQLERLLKVD